jgi:arginine/lysine/ornithine decarboxylase
MCLDLKKIVSTIRERYPELIVFIDEAWGAHLHFSEKLPTSAMEAGADICVQSTHKQGGSLQQSGMIHWKEGRINNDLLLESYRSLGTSSPSYVLLASLDAARETMQKKGAQKIERMLSHAKRLASAVNAIEGLRVVSTSYLQENYPSVHERDETKVVVDVAHAGLNGYEVAKILEKKYKIVVESYNIRTILFIVPFRATLRDVQTTARALQEIVKRPRVGTITGQLDVKIPTNIPRILELNEVTKLLWNQVEKVPLRYAVGRIAAEYITPFPPGIPITIKGEELTREIIEYYLKLKAHPNVHIAARDKSLESVWVVK